MRNQNSGIQTRHRAGEDAGLLGGIGDMKLPKDWDFVALRELADVNPNSLGGGTSPTYRFRYIDLSSVERGRVNIPEEAISFVDAPSRARRIIQSGDIVMSMVRPNLQGHAYFAQAAPDLIASTGFAVIRTTGADPRFVYQSLFGGKTTSQLERLLVGSNYPAINSSDVEELLLALPSKAVEQKKIADILSTWDEAIEKLDSLITAKARRKKALMQQLLTGKKRLKGSGGKWKTLSLGDALAPVSRTVQKPATPYLAAGIRSHGKGVFLKPAFKPEDIALEELSELRAGDLVVNITFAWEGAAAIVSDEADGALVSHRFPSFEFKAGKASRSFFRHYILSKRFVFDCGLASPGGAGRNRVLSKSAFFNIELKLPSIEEQERIGKILDAARR